MNTKEFMNMDIHKDKVVDLEIAGEKYPVTIKGEIDNNDVYMASEIGKTFCFADGEFDPSRYNLARCYCYIKTMTDMEIDDEDAESVAGFARMANNFDITAFIRDNAPNPDAYFVISYAFTSAYQNECERRQSVFGIIDEIKELDFKEMLGDDVVNTISRIAALDDGDIVKSILEYRKEEGVLN